VPVGLREAGLAESTARVRPVYPAAALVPVPPSGQAFAVWVGDGKALKPLAQRLKPLQGRKGGILGGTARVARELASGLAVALATHADGATNAAKLLPARVPQVRPRVAGPRVWVADRQCCDLTQTAAFAAEQAPFVVRSHPQTHFCPDPTRPVPHGEDPQGRVWVEDGGWWGGEQAQHRRCVRRITLERPGEETVILLTDWLDAAPYPATDLVALSLARGGIERGFQPMTAVFPLQARSGTTPQGPSFQLAFCLVLYTLRQGGRAYVATAPARPPETISTDLLFADVQRHLVALSELVPPPAIEPLFEPLPSPDRVGQQLTRLLAAVWTPRWLKAPAKKARSPTTRTAIRGNQTSVYRLLVAYRQQQQIVMPSTMQ